MEFTHAHALYERQDGQDLSGIEYDTTVVVFGIFAICLVAVAPMVWMLIWMRNDDNPRPIRRQLQRQRNLPTTERPAQDMPRNFPAPADRARLITSGLRGRVVAAGHAIASRSQDTYLKLQDCLAKLSPTSLRRRNAGTTADPNYDLPIMRKPAWQRLAGSNTSDTVGRSRKAAEEESGADDGGGGGGKAEDKPGASGASGGCEVEVVVDVQKPKAVVAAGWMGGLMKT